MEKVKTHIINPHLRAVEMTVQHLRRNNIVLLPGDTSYFLAIRAGKQKTLKRMNLIKGVSGNTKKFYSIMLGDFKDISEYSEITDSCFQVMRRCLPGPYTFIVPGTNQLPKIILQKRKEVGIRIPHSNFIQNVLKDFGEPLLVSTAKHDGNNEFFDDPGQGIPGWLSSVDLFVNAGYIPHDLTTIIRMKDGNPEIIRTGKGSLEPLI